MIYTAKAGIGVAAGGSGWLCHLKWRLFGVCVGYKIEPSFRFHISVEGVWGNLPHFGPIGPIPAAKGARGKARFRPGTAGARRDRPEWAVVPQGWRDARPHGREERRGGVRGPKGHPERQGPNLADNAQAISVVWDFCSGVRA